MKIKYFFPFFILLFPYLMIAQTSSTTLDNDIGFCLTDELHRQYQQSDNKYQNKHTDFEKSMYLLQQHNLTVSNEKIINEVVPVVVHIIHNEGEENIGDNQVLAAMEHLNDAFANTGFYDPETGVEVGIEFCLAVRTPDGQATTGINRVQSTFTELTAETQDIDLKSVIQWNSHDYLNIWVVKEIISASAGSGVAGYAYLPSSHGELKDGIVVEANYFGLNAHASKVLIHEAGHYLGLYHTFEGSCTNNDCLVDGDRICDTPPDQSTASIACELDINSCTTDENDSSENNPFRSMALGGIGEQDDMVINYMDYGKKECKTAFTAGQSVRMVNALTTTRQSLGASLACVPPCLLPSFPLLLRIAQHC